MKPIINISDLKYTEHQDGKFHAQYAPVSDEIGAKLLGYSLTKVPSKKMVCPFHNHRNNEEMFFILEGSGELRFGDKKYPVKSQDFIACPPGGRDVAHQLINTGSTELIYISLSTTRECDVVESPDSDKLGVYVKGSKSSSNHNIRHLTRMSDAVDYFDGELNK